jgi:transketolase
LNLNISNSEEFAKHLRGLSLKMVSRAGTSHIGGVLSMADIVAVLYFEILNLFPEEPKHPDRDRLILSKGHCCSGIYAALALRGFFPLDELDSFAEDLSPMMAHISNSVDGVEFSTGALGHGLPFGVGKAIFAKRHKLIWHTYVILSDGELDEGSNWEAIMFAAHHNLNNLTIIIDYNNLQSLDTIEKTLALEPIQEKFKSFGCNTIRLNGHDHQALMDTFHQDESNNKPKVIIADTIKGKGVSFMENQVLWHYKPPNEDELKLALDEVGFVE